MHWPSRSAQFANWVIESAFATFAVIFTVRCGLLMPAVVFNERREILRRGWELSRGQFWRLAAVGALVVVLPGVLLESVGELMSGKILATSAAAGGESLAAAADALALNDLAIAAIVTSLSLGAALCLVLTTIASSIIYRRLQDIA